MSGSRWLRFAAFALVCPGSTALGQDQWSPDPNQNNAVAIVGDVQSVPIVVDMGLSGHVFAWRSARFDVGTGTTVYDIDAQRFDANGVPQWGPTGVRVVSGSVSPVDRFSMVASTGALNIGVILAWHDIRNSPDAGDIYAQKLNTAGIPQWTVNGVEVTTAFDLQERPILVSDESDGAVIAWQDRRAGNSDIYAQRLNGSGLPQWVASDVPVCAAAGDQLEAAAFSFFAEQVITVAITWTDSRGGDQDIYAQRLSLAGGPQWTLDGVPVSAASGNQSRPVIGVDTFDWLIAWEDDRNGGDSDIYAQAVSPSGVPKWTAGGVQVASTPNASAPIVVPYGYIVWQDERNGASNVDIFAQYLDYLGVPQWPVNGVTVSAAVGNQTAPVGVFVVDSNFPFLSGLVVAWEDTRNGAPDVFAQRLPPDGTPAWTPDGVAISTAADRQGKISIASVISVFIAGAVLVWEDERNIATSADIYAAKVSASGVLPVELKSFSVE